MFARIAAVVLRDARFARKQLAERALAWPTNRLLVSVLIPAKV
jgi:hypothetical protein